MLSFSEALRFISGTVTAGVRERSEGVDHARAAVAVGAAFVTVGAVVGAVAVQVPPYEGAGGDDAG